ncbi:MAG: HAMP domain-containing histidine kinase [Burkholderiales bacterium]|jgi:two-component system sensor histidine kinase GlrK|nr:HAMP domain-containing histidine kinase [Burkholderiales bacterium]
MRFLQPNSFPRLLVVGFAMVALPLILALVNNAVSINQFASRSQLAVQQAVQSTQASRRLAELLGALERNARQMAILGDRSLLDAYESNRAAFLKVAGEFAALPFDAEQRAALDEIVRGEAEIHALLSGSAGSAGLRRAAGSFVRLDSLARGIIERGDRLIDREVEAMRETAARAQVITFWQMLALVPVALLLAAGFTVLIARPIRQIDAAIRRLGGGDFSAPVGVSGPRDLQMVGRRIEWLRHRLNELEQQKNRFLRQVSHELKTPLTALREGSELLSEEALGRLTPEQQEVAGILKANSIELQRLIEDLLSYGAAEYQRSAMRFAQVEARRVVARVLDDQNLALRARALRVAPHVEDVTLEADPEKLRIMLDNLLSNAVKFSPEGGVIEVDVRRDGEHAVIEVSDAGPGIPPAERERVFDPFFRGRSVAGGPLRGSGIGLSVVRDYAQAHGGTVEVVDEPRQTGARLRVRLPLRQGMPA